MKCLLLFALTLSAGSIVWPGTTSAHTIDPTNWPVIATTTTSPTDHQATHTLPTLTASDHTYADQVLGWLPSLLDAGNPLTIVLILGAVF